MPPPMMPFVYAPMRLKGELIKQHPADETKIPTFDLVLGAESSEPDGITRFGEYRAGSNTIGTGRFLYKLHDVVAVQGGFGGPYDWHIVLEPGVCAIEVAPAGKRFRPGSEGFTIDTGAQFGTIGINVMPIREVTHHEKEPRVFHAHSWENNYYHRVMDSLPRAWAEEEDLVPAGTPWAARDQIAIRYDTLYFPSFWPAIGFSPHPVAWLRKRLKRNPARDRRSVLYLSRADATKRRVTNEDEVVKALGDMGFAVTRVTMNGLSLERQVELAERAEFIIGPHGAAMTNVVFGSEATVIEFVPDKFQHPVFGYLAKWAGNQYRRILCAGDHDTAMTVSLEALHEATRD